MSAQATQYSGDGTIHTCSNLFEGGYGIDFASFDSSRPYSASYRLSHVPQTRRGHAVILLHFFQSDYRLAQKKKSSVTASFRFTLRDARGNIVHSAELRASGAVWSESQRLFGIYELDRSYLHFEGNANYILDVSYTPGAVPLPAKQLYFAIDNCAYY